MMQLSSFIELVDSIIHLYVQSKWLVVHISKHIQKAMPPKKDTVILRYLLNPLNRHHHHIRKITIIIEYNY